MIDRARHGWRGVVGRTPSSNDQEMAALHRTAFPPDRWGGAWPAESFGRMRGSPAVLFVEIVAAAPASRLIGLAVANHVHDEIEILTLCRNPELKGAGLGLALISSLETAAFGRGVRRLILEVGADNKAARRLYATTGFSCVGRRIGYYAGVADGREDALVLEKCLRGAE